MDKYCLFSWGMQRHAQLGNGDAVTTQSAPRPISYLQDVMIYSVIPLALSGFSENLIDGVRCLSFRSGVRRSYKGLQRGMALSNAILNELF